VLIAILRAIGQSFQKQRSRVAKQTATVEELLEGYQAADTAAFDQFYIRTNRLLFSFLFSKLKNRGDAEDALQNTYLKIHRSIFSYKRGDPAMPWVFTIARNAAIDCIRRRRFGVSIDLETIAAPDDTPSAEQILQELTDALQELPTADRALLQKRFLEDESYEQIARDAGLTAANARQRISRLLKKVRQRFQPS
jgi:RNA polymerase sigma-70 factor, ECF subfamily